MVSCGHKFSSRLKFIFICSQNLYIYIHICVYGVMWAYNYGFFSLKLIFMCSSKAPDATKPSSNSIVKLCVK